MTAGRSGRIAGQLKKEISDILRNELKDPRVKGMTSITGVEITRDLRYAKVYVSVFGTDEEKIQTFQALEKAKGFIRSEVGQRIRLRYVPEIIIEEDQSIEYGARINQMLRSLNQREDEK